MELSEMIQRLHTIATVETDLKIEKKKVLSMLKEEIMPYERGSIILCKGKYHNSKEGRVIRYRIDKKALSWHVVVVVMCIGDDGSDMHPTDWDNFSDSKLQESVDRLNKIDHSDKILQFE